jgi:hypothetical protein
MRKSFTAVLEQGTTFTEDFYTEPYEVAWATEARWFIRVLEIEGGKANLQLSPEISPDGLFWCQDGTPSLQITGEGLYSLAQRDFGHWLRLNGRVSGKEARLKLIVYLALKE